MKTLILELERRKITHSELATILGMKYQTLSTKLSGKYRMDEKTALAIKEVLQVDMSVEELFKPMD